MSSRLPRTTIPSHYDLVIRTDLLSQTFSGTCEISLEIHERIPSILIHVAQPLKLQSVVLGRLNKDGSLGEPRKLSEKRIDEKLQRATLEFEGGDIEEGSYVLGCSWEGVLDDSLAGYYVGSYVPEGKGEDEKTYHSMTQFQPCDARKAYPCFDEPDLKATFTIAMISRSGTTSLSNMNDESTEPLKNGGTFPRTELLTDAFFSNTQEPSDQGQWEIVRFAKTPKMSTYLAAWANGDFGYVEGGCTSALAEGRHIPMRIYALPHQAHQAKYALRVSERILPILERFFDIPYPLPKLDTLASPGFGNGAMENWGLIIGGASLYLMEEEKAGIAAKKLLVSVTSHEIAHQWFGNITTMEWWDDLWLNEAFATIVGEVSVLEELEPSWETGPGFIAEHLSRALQLDSVRSSHPIQMPCPDEATINQIFDAVSYSKGATVLKMLSNFVGQENFLKGVSTYLKRHLYGNARTADLLKGISDVYGKDISKMMENWTTKIGFPLITVEETAKGIKIRQNRFLSTADATPEEDETIWQVPLEPLIVEDGDKKSIKHGVLLTEREDILEIDDVADTTYKLNAETCGVYRVLYPADRLVKIAEEAGKENSAFSLQDRMGLVQDAVVLASSGYAKTSTALSLLSKLENEKENLVCQAIAQSLATLAQTWQEQPEDVRRAIDKFRCKLFRPILARVGSENSPTDSVNTVELRTLAITTLADAGDEEVLREYGRRFGAFLSSGDESLIPGDLRPSIYAQSVKNGSEKEWRKMLEVHRNPPTPLHKKAARSALCSSRDPELIRETLGLISSGEIPNHEWASFGTVLRTHPVSARIYWDWFKTNYDMVVGRFESFYLAANVAGSFKGFTSRKDYDEVKEFFADKERSGYEQAYAQGLDLVLSNAEWLERDTEDVAEWLKTNQYL